jgi:nucleoporin GLE1
MEAHSLFSPLFGASQMAGFALYTRYKSQFMKILDIISGSFLPALKQPGRKVNAEAVTNLEYYITGKLYLKEPEGRHLATGLLSRDFAV